MIKRAIFCILIFLFITSFSYARDPEEAVKLLYEAWNKYGEERIKLLSEIIEKYPNTGCAERAQNDIAGEYNSLGNLEKATQEYRKYIEKYPQTEKAESAQSWIAQRLFGEGKYEEALTEYRKFLKLFPNSSTKVFAECRIADIEYDKLKIITPQEAIEKYLEIYEKAESKYYCFDAYWIIASIFENDLNNYKEAILYYKKFLSEDSKMEKAPEVLWQIAECYRKMEDFPQALDGYEDVVRRYPGSRFAQDSILRIAFYGNYFEEKNRYEEAIKAYSKFIELSLLQGRPAKDKGEDVRYGYDREIMRRAANIHKILKEFDKAISIYKQILLSGEEFLQGGFTDFDKSIKYQINQADIYSQLEFIYTETGKFKEAKEAHEKAKEIEKDISNIKEVITEKFIGKEEHPLNFGFDSIDIKNNEAIAEVGLFYGNFAGCGYRIWLNRKKQGWIIKKLEETWVA